MWTPAIALPATSTVLELSWNAVAYDPVFRDGYEVRIMTTAPTGSTGNIGNMVTASTVVFRTTGENPSWTARKVNLTAYAGETIYIGFRNNSHDQFLLLIDDVQVAQKPDYLGELSEVAGFEYTQYPLHQAAPIALSGGTITNMGEFPLTNVRMNASVQNRVGYEVFAAETIETAILNPDEQETFSFDIGWEPIEWGNYE